jgi:hypothetical protein
MHIKAILFLHSGVVSSEGPAKGEPTEGPAKGEPTEDTDKITRKRNMFRDSIDQIDLSVNVGAENGLFQEAKKRDKTLENIFEDILNKLNEAKENLSKEKYPYAKTEKNISEATEYYSRALYAPKRTWRYVNMYGIYVWFYLIGILAAVFFVFFYGSGPLTKGLHIDQAALNAAGWGVIAAVVRALWFLRGTVDENRYRKSWNLYFMSIPFIGGILGSIVYLIIIGGLLAVSTTTTTITTTTNTTAAAAAPKTITATPNPLAIIPFAALAGYNWEWAINILNRIGELVETRPPPDRRSKPPIAK